MSTTSSTAETHVIPLIWDLEITDKQKRKEEKRNRRKERKARKNPDFMTSSNMTSTSTASEVTRGCGSPTFLLSRGINFDRSDFDKNGFFPTGSKLILKCEDGAKPHPKVSLKMNVYIDFDDEC